MTDRDLFAAAALAGLLTRREYDACEFATACEYSYRYADAMLRERDATTEKVSDVRDSRNAKTTNHDAVPAAIARTDADRNRTDKAALRPGEGTGNTQEMQPTPSECSEPREGTSEPVAWAVVLNAIEAISMNGGATYRVTVSKDDADRIAAHAMAVVPLYERQPQPTLTDAERAAVGWAAEMLEVGSLPRSIHGDYAATLRGLLERTK